MRHDPKKLVYDIDTVDFEIVWEVIQTKLPDLEQAAERLVPEDE